MRWRPSRSIQVEDRRGGGGFGGGLGGLRMGGGGGGMSLPVGGGLGGIVLIIIVYVVINMMGGGSVPGSGQGGQGGAVTSLDPNDREGQFINSVTGDLQAFWEQQFAAADQDYPETVTVLFTGQTQSGCGMASSATGPFYCPADQKIYLDTDFFKELSTRFGAPGDFAQAYVLAHEYGHHVQDALGP